MINHISKLKETAIPMFITQSAFRTAQNFARQQLIQAKRQEVYFNTLAVCIVDNYLQMMSISTELTNSDSWNAAMRFAADVADLKVTGIGYLECRPVRNYEQATCHIPLDVSEDRIGIVVVEINELQATATLIGFTKTIETGDLPLTRLQPINSLIDHLDFLRTESLKRTQDLVNLRQWLQNSFEPAWQPFRGIWDTNQRNLALGLRGNFQSSEINIQRAKVIDLGFSLGNQSVSLVVAIVEQVNQEVCVVVQVYPFGVEKYLPLNLRLLLHSKSWSLPKEIKARSQDVCIQTNRFWCDPGEEFSIELALNEFSAIEHFVV